MSMIEDNLGMCGEDFGLILNSESFGWIGLSDND